jgi:Rad3-related DNA helicase
MTESNVINSATRRLQSALASLEAALEQRLEGDHEQSALANQVHALGVDRSRLANELDTAMARSRHLEITNREVVRRLAAAMDTIRTVLNKQGAQEE